MRHIIKYETNIEVILLAKFKINVIDFRKEYEFGPKTLVFDNAMSAKNNFDGVVIFNTKHILNNWCACSDGEVWTRIELYEGDTLIQQIILNAGIFQQHISNSSEC